MSINSTGDLNGWERHEILPFKAEHQLRAVYVVIIDQNTVTQAEPSAGAREHSKATSRKVWKKLTVLLFKSKRAVDLRSAREPFIVSKTESVTIIEGPDRAHLPQKIFGQGLWTLED